MKKKRKANVGKDTGIKKSRSKSAPSSSGSGGQSPNSPLKCTDPCCSICMEHKSSDNFFSIKNCSHQYCSSCVCTYVKAKLDENVTLIGCPDPGCGQGSLDLEHCQPILSPEVYDEWGRAACDAMFVGSARFYCPFKDCSGLLIREEEVVMESECPYCHRLFCAQCKVPWHSGVLCGEGGMSGTEAKEDSMLKKMAKRQKWQRCPKCNFFVSRTAGCNEIVCRCKFKFCYICGVEWSPSHYNCKRVPG